MESQSATTPAENVIGEPEDYLDLRNYFMAKAVSEAKKSKVGACIVNFYDVIVGKGYNGRPLRCKDALPRGNDKGEDNEDFYDCHAAVNAFFDSNLVELRGCTLYVSEFPCNECAKLIIQTGIRRVAYDSDAEAEKIETIATKKMFDAAYVTYWQQSYKKKND